MGVKATFGIPPTYPDVAASVTIEAEKGLSSSQTSELTAFAESKALENVGMAMVYTLVDLLREWLAEHNLAGQDGSMHAEMLKRVYMKEKEQQREKDVAAAVRVEGGCVVSCLCGHTSIGGPDSHLIIALQKARAAAIASGQDEEDELNRQKKLEGTAVTTEAFIAWRVRIHTYHSTA